jgi:heme oxygenase
LLANWDIDYRAHSMTRQARKNIVSTGSAGFPTRRCATAAGPGITACDPLHGAASSVLEERLREGTRELHRAVERGALMRALLCGELPSEHYLALLRNLRALYAELETQLRRHATHPEVAAVVFPALFRSQALQADIDSLSSVAKGDPALCEATVEYVARLVELGDAQPELLAAHAYVRYLGDLNGGQILRRALTRSACFPHGTGTAFYEFGDDGAIARHTDAFRSGLGALACDSARVRGLVDEARWSFRQHVLVFEQLLNCS